MGKNNTIQNTISITIDNQVCEARAGETILQIARKNGIYIPTMCYLTKVEPIASCRMCVVEVDGVDGAILACQEQAVDGAVVRTTSDKLFEQRQNIMKLYNVNHPLECGVCDKSGECDLQNKTLEFGVKEQTFSTKEPKREIENWGFISYDPSLCIMCEKCVHVCNEIVGDGSLAISVGGYNSTIINTNLEQDCSGCGECMAVCPVGALVSTDFKYTSNAWELKKIPAACVHCSSGCPLYYETKAATIEHNQEKIYRVTNPFEFSSLCGAGRFAFDFANTDAKKDTIAFSRAIEAFKEAESVAFSAMITNEEAFILESLRKKMGFNLVCPEAYGYQKFLEAFGSTSSNTLYSGDLSCVKSSDAIIVLGGRINDDNPMVKYHIAMASKRNRARVVYCHPLEDTNINALVTQFIKYEVGSEEGVVALLGTVLLKNATLPLEIESYFEDLDIGNLSAESNVGEDELEKVAIAFERKKSKTLIVGADVYNHPRAKQIGMLLGVIERYSDLRVLLVPPATNALGVSLICSLDSTAKGYTVGYHANGNFRLSALGDGDLDMPALNQQEGTLTTVDKQVVPINVALDYHGYTLNDIANALGLLETYTIDYTPKLPTKQGFKAVEFDTLADSLDSLGNDTRGYRLENKNITTTTSTLEAIAPLPTYDGALVYWSMEGLHFNRFTARAKQDIKAHFRGSEQFAKIAQLRDKEVVVYRAIENTLCEQTFVIDSSLKGTIAISPTPSTHPSGVVGGAYRFSLLEKQEDEER